MWMYRGNLSLHTFFNIFFSFENFRICSNLVGFNRINSIVILLNVQNQLKKYIGNIGGISENVMAAPFIKLEPAFLAENEEALFAAGYTKNNYSSRYFGNFTRINQWSGNRVKMNSSNDSFAAQDDRPKNLIGSDGRIMTCFVCGSYRHMN